ncbi:MAG: hypothetical protein ACO1PW_02475 [Actinomycetota bacterium]
MQTGRRTVLAVAAVLGAALPGALTLPQVSGGLDRAVPPVLVNRDAPLPPSPDLLLPDATPIAPPPAELVGALAPAQPPPPGYAPAAPATGEVLTLSVGIDDYPGSRADLRWAGADAVTVDDALARFGVPASNRVLLRDGQARRDALVAAIRSLVAQAGPGTKAVFAFAGHVRKLDADTEAMVTADGALITDAELAALLAPIQADQVWVLMATCYAGGFTEVLGPGRILTGAADAGSLAYESSAVGGSYLVHHLVREGWLEGGAGPTVQDAFAYAAAATVGQPDRKPVQVDQAGGPLWFGPAGASRPASPAPAPRPSSPAPGPAGGSTDTSPSRPPSPPPPPEDDDEETCTLLVLCS